MMNQAAIRSGGVAATGARAARKWSAHTRGARDCCVSSSSFTFRDQP
jgi:hypothetical protein